MQSTLDIPTIRKGVDLRAVPTGVYKIEGTESKVTIEQRGKFVRVFFLRPASVLRCTSCGDLVKSTCQTCHPGEVEYDPFASDYEMENAESLTDQEREFCEANDIPLWHEKAEYLEHSGRSREALQRNIEALERRVA